MSEQKHKLTMVMAMADKFTAPFSKVTSMTQKGAVTFEKTQAKLSELQQASGKVETFRKLQSSTQETSQALDQARVKAQMMTKELSGMTNPTKKQTAALEKQWQEVSRLEQAQKAEVKQLNHLRGDLYKVGVSTRDLDAATRQIATETQRYTKKLDDERASLQRMASTQEKVNKLKERNRTLTGEAVADTAKVTAAGLALKGMVSTYGEVASAQGELQSLGVGAEGIDKITKAAREFSQQWSGTTQEQFITASYDIKSGISSLSDTAVGEFTKIAALTAGATKSSTAQMTALFASGYNIYRQQFDQFGAETVEGWNALSATERDARFGEYFSAGIAASVQAFKTNGQEMTSAISSLGAAATSANVPFSEQLAILGQLQATMSGSEAATKYAAFLGSAANAGDKLGLNFMDANDQLKSMPEILEELRQSYGDTLDAVEKQELKKAFGTDEAMDLIDLMYPKLDQLESNITGMNDSLKGGLSTTMKMASDILNGPNESLALFEQRFSGLVIVLGKAVAPAVQFVADKFGQLFVWITNLLERFPILANILGTAIVAFIGLKTAMIATKVVQIALNMAMMKNIQLTGAMGVVQQALALKTKAMAAAQWAFNAAMSANPIGLVIMAVMALIGVVALIIKYWEPIGDFFNSLWDGVVAKFMGAFDYISGIVGKVSGWWNSLFGDSDDERSVMVKQQLATSGGPSAMSYSAGNVTPKVAQTGIPARGGSAGAYTDNSQMNITVETHPGMDERAIADAVQRKIDENKRVEARQRRGALYD